MDSKCSRVAVGFGLWLICFICVASLRRRALRVAYDGILRIFSTACGLGGPSRVRSHAVWQTAPIVRARKASRTNLIQSFTAGSRALRSSLDIARRRTVLIVAPHKGTRATLRVGVLNAVGSSSGIPISVTVLARYRRSRFVE
jgi:hypothetical protein